MRVISAVTFRKQVLIGQFFSQRGTEQSANGKRIVNGTGRIDNYFEFGFPETVTNAVGKTRTNGEEAGGMIEGQRKG